MLEDNQEHLDICHSIESALKEAYELDFSLTDTMCIYALDNAKIAVKKQFGFAKSEAVSAKEELQSIIGVCVDVGVESINNDLSLKDYLNLIEKIKRSVRRHSEYGVRGYYDFIKDYV